MKTIKDIKISIDDGCASDLKVIDMALEAGIEDIVLYLPTEWHSLAHYKGYEPLSYADLKPYLEFIEIGSHTLTHRHLTKLPEMEARYEITASKQILQDLTGQPITKFAPPRGYMSKPQINFALIEAGYEEVRLTKGKGLVHVHPNSGANDNRHWLDCIDEETKEIWGHGHEWRKFNMFDEIEEFFKNGK